MFATCVPYDLAGKVNAMAVRLERSDGGVKRRTLAVWRDREEERHRMTLEALADVESRHVIDHQAVQVWADSLGTDKPLPSPAGKWRSDGRARRRDDARIGEKLEAYQPREVRRLIVGNYELRYEIAAGTIFILRLWHCRESRGFRSEE